MINAKQISDFESRYKMVIPVSYKEFLQNENGINFNGGTILYSLDELKQMNDNLQIQEYQPNYLAIGDDGGGLVFLMRQDPDAKEVICVDISDYDTESPFYRIENFTDWYKDGCKIHTETKEDNRLSKAGDVFLIKEPKNGMKDLIKIKQAFNMDIATSQLLALSKELPCMVIRDIKYAKAIKLMEKIGQPDIFEFCENSG